MWIASAEKGMEEWRVGVDDIERATMWIASAEKGMEEWAPLNGRCG